MQAELIGDIISLIVAFCGIVFIGKVLYDIVTNKFLSYLVFAIFVLLGTVCGMVLMLVLRR